MKNLTFLFLSIFLFSAALTGQRMIRPSAEITTVTYDNLGEFTEIIADDDVRLYFSSTDGPESIEVETNENLQDKVQIEVRGSRLYVGQVSNLSINGRETFIVRINTKNKVTSFVVDDDAIVEVLTPLNHRSLNLDISDDAKFTAEINAKEVMLDVYSDGIVNLSGSVDYLDANLKSDGIVRAYDLTVKELKIYLISDAEASFTVTDKLRARAGSDAVLYYRGNPKIATKIATGDATIRQRGR